MGRESQQGLLAMAEQWRRSLVLYLAMVEQ